MRIVRYTSDTSGARAAYRFHRGLIAENVDSTMLVGSKSTTDSTVTVAPPDQSIPGNRTASIGEKRRIASQIDSHADSIAKGFELFSNR